MNKPMTQKRKAHFEQTLARARAARQQGQRERAWQLLEEAHILGQEWIVPHLRSHWAMFVFAVLQFHPGEMVGQLLRLALVAPGTWLGRLPIGNTGRANVSPFRPMPIPEDLRKLMAE